MVVVMFECLQEGLVESARQSRPQRDLNPGGCHSQGLMA